MKVGRGAKLWLLGSALGCVCACSDPDSGALPQAEPALTVSIPPAGFPQVSADASDAATREARAQLGKKLFYDRRLSRTGDVACATCHVQEHAFADPNSVSIGVEGRRGTRNAPSLVNAAWGKSFFWDGRAKTLEDQVAQPIENPSEMDLPLAQAVARVAEDSTYTKPFQRAYGQEPSAAALQGALASFVRSLVSGQSAYDRHLRGDDADFDEQRLRGEALFFSDRAGCFHCHPAGVLSNEGFFNNGTYTVGTDTGRQQVTMRAGDIGKFKVPGLRNVEVTGPYLHDGSLSSLEAVIEQYDAGGRGDPRRTRRL